MAKTKSGDKPVKSASKTTAKPAEKATKAKAAGTTATKAAAPKTEKKAAAPKAAAPKKTPAAKKSPGSALAPDQRRFYVEVAAYYIAERRGFHGGSELDDWVEAEKEIDRLLREGILNP